MIARWESHLQVNRVTSEKRASSTIEIPVTPPTGLYNRLTSVKRLVPHQRLETFIAWLVVQSMFTHHKAFNHHHYHQPHLITKRTSNPPPRSAYFPRPTDSVPDYDSLCLPCLVFRRYALKNTSVPTLFPDSFATSPPSFGPYRHSYCESLACPCASCVRNSLLCWVHFVLRPPLCPSNCPRQKGLLCLAFGPLIMDLAEVSERVVTRC